MKFTLEIPSGVVLDQLEDLDSDITDSNLVAISALEKIIKNVLIFSLTGNGTLRTGLSEIGYVINIEDTNSQLETTTLEEVFDSPSESESTSESLSASVSESVSTSTSISASDSNSDSMSTSNSDSGSTSTSQSTSDSTSTSLSNSESVSESNSFSAVAVGTVITSTSFLLDGVSADDFSEEDLEDLKEVIFSNLEKQGMVTNEEEVQNLRVVETESAVYEISVVTTINVDLSELTIASYF